MNRSLANALRLTWITDGRADVARIVRIATAAVAGGLASVVVREPKLSAAALARVCDALRPILADVGGLVLVNDRADVAAAGRADGVHLRADSLPPADVRGFLPRAVIGVSVHTLAELVALTPSNVDYAILAPVLPTSSKPAATAIGIDRAAEWAAAAQVPVVWLGGVDATTIERVAAARPFGVAVRSAIADAADPRATTAELLAALSRGVRT